MTTEVSAGPVVGEQTGSQAARPADGEGAGRCLVEVDLSGQDLTGKDFRGADLTRANLREARCAGAQFQGATLYGADLTGAEFMGADFAGANLEQVRGRRAGFGGANLEAARLFSADLADATFGQANLNGADLRAATLVDARLAGARLRHADLTRADLSGAYLEESDLARACFDEATLRNAHLRQVRNFRQASWIAADVRDVNFAGAWLVRREILDQNYLHEFRRQDRWHALVFRVWWLTSDCGRSVSRWMLFVLGVALVFGTLYTQVDLDLGTHPTVLSPWYFSVVTLTTLGYGDVVPRSSPAQLVVVAEVVLGYLGLGGLLSILSSKMTRRAE